MTDAEKITALEARLQVFEDFFRFGVSDDRRIPYVMTMGRVGVMTEYWSKKPWGQGAACSVGTECDRFGLYVEVEAAAPDVPTTAIYAHVTVPNPQKNIAIEAHVANSSAANIVLHADGDGIEVGASIAGFYLGKIGGALRRLWPAPLFWWQ